ncbi:unnamed protein product [Dibothriocephalus latus]|uniref:Uncharacterized protein n=1 Tax=Dibothriocephalus latus TaxID=60516 RepID=A0A3P6TC82_DIBLA|nr:unnamed protein product [Dibothriocephalus latus]
MNSLSQTHFHAAQYKNIRFAEYPYAELLLETWQCAYVLVAFCFVANIFNFPGKMILLDIVSVLLIWRINGWQFAITVIVISIAFSVFGAYLGRSPLFVLIVGMLMLGNIKHVLLFCLPQEFVSQIFAVPMSSPGFIDSVVRSIILGIEHTRMRSVSLRDLLCNSIGYTVMSPICMLAPFVHFQDWRKWREGTTKFTVTNRHHLEEERPPPRTGETVRRTISIRRVLVTILRLGFWTLILKYGFGSIDFIGQMCGPVRRISRGLNVLQLDGFLVYFIAFINVGKFHLFYVLAYGYCMIVGDLQQFMLSPLFAKETLRLVLEPQDTQSEFLLKSTQDLSIVEDLISSEVTINCLMPDPPRCPLGTLQSSEVWR